MRLLALMFQMMFRRDSIKYELDEVETLNPEMDRVLDRCFV